MAAAVYNQSDADEEKEKTLCFRLWDFGGSRFDWYKLDLKKTGGGSVLKMGCPPLISSRARCSSVVALGSVIYILGGRIQLPVNGDNGFRDDVYSFDTQSPESVWKEAPRMLCPGWYTGVASLHDKLCVISEICQVFDPIRDTWLSISELPADYEGGPLTPIISDSANGRFLVYFRNSQSLYAFYLDTKKWELLVKGFDLFWDWGQSVVVDNVLYFHPTVYPFDDDEYEREFLFAFDLVEKKWLTTLWSKPFDLNYCDLYWKALLHLGNGILCLVNHAVPYTPGYEDKSVQCMRFRVQKTSDGMVSMAALSFHLLSFEDFPSLAAATDFFTM